MKRIVFFTAFALTAFLAAAEKNYDFRSSEAYAQLSVSEKERLEKVRHDHVLLWGALEMFCDEHDDPPATLDELVPKYLKELPSDPFATEATAAAPMAYGYTASKKGLGYRYKKGAPGNRAWIISSVGLPRFPYLAERGNIGLYVCKGTWLSGINPQMTK